jgi:hypothetical protein
MKMWRPILFLVISLFTIHYSQAQCSVCTKTAEQLGEGPASALNNAIVYLMMMPLAIMGIVGYRWWKKEKAYASFEQGKKS